ncbi:MAG: hypothetical protein AAF633_21245 [Chloroflexota bacterium]
MESNYLTFDYQSGTVRRDFIREGRQVTFFKIENNTEAKKWNVLASIRNLFGLNAR